MNCKVCVWTFNHQEELNIIVDREKAFTEFKKRKEQLYNHYSSCLYKEYANRAGAVPKSQAGSIPQSVESPLSIAPSDSVSASTVTKKRKRNQTLIKSSFYKDSAVDKDTFEKNVVNVIASTGVSFNFFENVHVVKMLTDLRPLVQAVIPSRKVVRARVMKRAVEEKIISGDRIKTAVNDGISAGIFLITKV